MKNRIFVVAVVCAAVLGAAICFYGQRRSGRNRMEAMLKNEITEKIALIDKHLSDAQPKNAWRAAEEIKAAINSYSDEEHRLALAKEYAANILAIELPGTNPGQASNRMRHYVTIAQLAYDVLVSNGATDDFAVDFMFNALGKFKAASMGPVGCTSETANGRMDSMAEWLMDNYRITISFIGSQIGNIYFHSLSEPVLNNVHRRFHDLLDGTSTIRNQSPKE